jgi:hypothetical protein
VIVNPLTPTAVASLVGELEPLDRKRIEDRTMGHGFSDASEEIFMKLRSRSSRATGPNTPVSCGWL